MLIDWFTVSVQILNFLVLIALLKRFLYGPLIRAMEERQRQIAKGFNEAAAVKEKAEALGVQLEREQQEFASSKNRLEIEARQEIARWKEESIERIRGEIADQRSDWQQELAAEREAFLQKLVIHINSQVFMVAGKVLADLADTSLEDRILENFLDKLRQESAIPEKDNDPDPKSLQVTTGFFLEEHAREKILVELGKIFPSCGDIVFHREEKQGIGISLLVGDQKWEWNLSRYMRDLENEILRDIGVVKGKSE